MDWLLLFGVSIVESLLLSAVGALLFVPMGLVIDMVLLGEEPENKLLQNLLDESLAVVPAITAGWMFINAPFVLAMQVVATKRDLPARAKLRHRPPHQAENASLRSYQPVLHHALY